jgi:hypothetical protein
MLATSAEQVQAAAATAPQHLYRVDWQEVTVPDAREVCTVLGPCDGLARALGAEAVRDVAALRTALDGGKVFRSA